MSKKFNSLDRNRLKLELENSLNKLKLDEVAEGIKVSVPNDSKFVVVSLDDKGVYTVKSPVYMSTYLKFEDALLEILECLVSRDLYNNGFSREEIRYVICNLIK